MVDIQREVNTRTTHELLARKEYIQKNLKIFQNQVHRDSGAEAPFDDHIERSITNLAMPVHSCTAVSVPKAPKAPVEGGQLP